MSILNCQCHVTKSNSILLVMHSLAAASWPRLSETKPKWLRRFAKVKIKSNFVTVHNRISSTCKLFISMYIFIILLAMRISA